MSRKKVAQSSVQAFACAADPVVAIPAEALAVVAARRRRSVQPRKRTTERRRVGERLQIQPFEDEERDRLRNTQRTHVRHPQRIRAPQCAQTLRFAVEHPGVASGGELDEVALLARGEHPCFTPAGGSDAAPSTLRCSERAQDGRSNRGFCHRT